MLHDMLPDTQTNGADAASGLNPVPCAKSERASRRQQVIWIIALTLSTLFGLGGQVIMKFGLYSPGGKPLSVQGPAFTSAWITAHPLVFVGLVVYCLGTLFWLMTVSRVDLSFVYPLTSINFVLVLLASRLLFGEALSWNRMAGVATIGLGVVLVSYRKSDKHVSSPMCDS